MAECSDGVAGGLDLGLERAGMECRWQVEKDEYCSRVLAKHWPGVQRLYNLELTEEEILHLWFNHLMTAAKGGFTWDSVDESILKKLEQLLELTDSQ